MLQQPLTDSSRPQQIEITAITLITGDDENPQPGRLRMFAVKRRVAARNRRRVATATAGALLDKALHLSTDVQSAMVSRGYRGEVRLIDDFHTTPIDGLALAGFAAIAAAALWLQA